MDRRVKQKKEYNFMLHLMRLYNPTNKYLWLCHKITLSFLEIFQAMQSNTMPTGKERSPREVAEKVELTPSMERGGIGKYMYKP